MHPFQAKEAPTETCTLKASEGLNQYTRGHPNREHRTKKRETYTEPDGPRQRADALGPPRQTGKRLGNGPDGAAAEPARDPSLVALETEIRQKLGERADWLSMASLVACTADAAKFAVLNIHQAMRQHSSALQMHHPGNHRRS